MDDSWARGWFHVYPFALNRNHVVCRESSGTVLVEYELRATSPEAGNEMRNAPRIPSKTYDAAGFKREPVGCASGQEAHRAAFPQANGEREHVAQDVRELLKHERGGRRLKGGKRSTHAENVLDGREKEHKDDAHAKYLDATAGHVEHKSLHGQRFSGGDGEVPSAFLLEGGVRGCCCRRCFGGFGLVRGG